MHDEQDILTRCTICGQTLRIGDFPFCPHESARSSHAQGFDPIVVHVSADGSYRFPASTSAPVPEGYRALEIRTIQEADRITREVNTQEDVKLREVQAQSDHNRSETRKRNRAFMDSRRDSLSPFTRQFMDRAREYQAIKDQERANSRPRSTNFHMDVFAHDSSNREQHSDERTGWRRRKG